MPSAEPCVSCRKPTTGRGRFSGQPVCRACSAKPPKETTLATIAGSRRKSARPAQCRICLADEVLSLWGNYWRSSLKGGVCKDRAACEARQPLLIPVEEL